MSLDNALQTAISTIPECVAAGYVDLSSGMLLGVKTVDSHPAEVMEILAAATSDMFQGTNVELIESLFRKSRGISDDNMHYFQEIIVNSANLLHVFLRSKKYPDHVVTFVCRKSANMGMVLTKAKMSIPKIEDAI
jgi:hypothetical protein